MTESLVLVDNVSKKFCRDLKRSLFYGMKDLGLELIGRSNGHQDLRKEEFWAIKDVSIEVSRGDTLGLIGRNGAGKTTLLRMLNGLIKLDAGRIEIRGRMQALIALGAGFNPILTGRENIYVNASVLGISKAEIDRRFDEIVDFSGIDEFIDTPVQSYSSGMAVRLGFAVAAHMEPDILLVDEVLAVGDEGFQGKCLNKIGELQKNGTAIILVSHNMHTISTFARQVALMNEGHPILFDNVSEGIKAYRKLFISQDEEDIQKVCSGNDKINFFQVNIPKRNFFPGETFSISMKYNSLVDFLDIEIDTVIYDNNNIGQYFQATNKAYSQVINLSKGTHELNIEIKNIPINNSQGIATVTIWAKDRVEMLFWWRIPIEFDQADHSTGRNFLNVSYNIE